MRILGKHSLFVDRNCTFALSPLRYRLSEIGGTNLFKGVKPLFEKLLMLLFAESLFDFLFSFE